jgi:ABC-2 type transport system permease protein
MTLAHASAQPIVADSPFTVGTRIREWVHDVVVLTRRNVQHIAREPMQLSDVTVQPILFTVLFTYVFGAGMSLPGGGSYKEFVLGGVLTLNLTTSTVGSAVGVSSDMKSGVIERFRTLPMSTTSILVARTVSDLVSGLLCALLVTAAGLAVGWRPHSNVASVIAAFAVVLLFSFSISWMSVCFGLAGSGPEAVQATAFIVLFPLSFISNAFVATQGMPRWLQTFADWNPVSAVAAAVRELFSNPNPSSAVGAWPMQHPVAASILWSIVIVSVCAPTAAWLLRRRTTN